MGTRSAVVKVVFLALALGGANGPLLGAPVPKEMPLDPSKVLELALKAAEKIENPKDYLWQRDHTLLTIAQEFALCGNLERARELFRSIAEATKDGPLRGCQWTAMSGCGLAGDAFTLVPGNEEYVLDAERMRNTGDVELLAKIVAKAKIAANRDRFRGALAWELARLGKLDEAEKVIAEMGGDEPRVKLNALAQLIPARHRAKQPERVAKLLADMSDHTEKMIQADLRLGWATASQRDYYLATLVTAQAECGDFDAAAASLKTYEKDCDIAYSQLSLATAVYKSGDNKKATQMVRDMAKLPFSCSFEGWQSGLVRWHADRREWKEAEALVAGMKEVYARCMCLQKLARAKAAAGDVEAGRRALNEAEQLAGPDCKNVKNPPGQLNPPAWLDVWRACLRVRTEIDGGKATLEEARKIADPFKRAEALLSIARGLRKRLPGEDY